MVLAVALRADALRAVQGRGRGHGGGPAAWCPAARRLDEVDALQLELLAEQGAEVVHPVAVRRARRGRMPLLVRALDANAPQTLVRAVRPRGAEAQGVLMLAVDRKERIARISVVGPASMVPELLPVPAHGAGSFDEGGMRVVWAEVPLEQADPRRAGHPRGGHELSAVSVSA